ncbi:MAG: class I SAM-dependent methyltransferase [Myxococcales bacterium]|nr:class I SAM-dependent methyltransferase [Myxococcales bacterium]
MATTSICPLCKASWFKHLGKKSEATRSRGDIRLKQCIKCHLVFLAERPDSFDADLYAYYARRDGKSQTELYDPLTTHRYQQLLDRFATMTHGRKLLDIGCGLGHFVHTAVSKGWGAQGIDLSESAINICKRFGVPASKQDIFDPTLSTHQYDVITMFELIEHLPTPSPFISRATELLRPGGLLYITTPNYNALDRRVQGLSWEPINGEHCVYFTPKTLLQLIKSIAPTMDVISLTTHNVSAQTLRLVLQPSLSLSKSQPAISLQGEPLNEVHHEERRLRTQLESSSLMRWSKTMANKLLNQTRLGNAMTLLAKT